MTATKGLPHVSAELTKIPLRWLIAWEMLCISQVTSGSIPEDHHRFVIILLMHSDLSATRYVLTLWLWWPWHLLTAFQLLPGQYLLTRLKLRVSTNFALQSQIVILAITKSCRKHVSHLGDLALVSWSRTKKFNIMRCTLIQSRKRLAAGSLRKRARFVKHY